MKKAVLLDQNPYIYIDAQEFKEIVTAAIKYGEPDILSMILYNSFPQSDSFFTQYYTMDHFMSDVLSNSNLSDKAIIDELNSYRLWVSAFKSNNPSTVKQILDDKHNKFNNDIISALLVEAASLGHTGIVEILLNKGFGFDTPKIIMVVSLLRQHLKMLFKMGI